MSKGCVHLVSSGHCLYPVSQLKHKVRAVLVVSIGSAQGQHKISTGSAQGLHRVRTGSAQGQHVPENRGLGGGGGGFGGLGDGGVGHSHALLVALDGMVESA